jgi:hypothetical protein
LAAVAIVVPLLAGWTLFVSDGNVSTAELVGTIGFLLVAPSYAGIGAVIIARQPRNSVGWMLMTIGLGMTIVVATEMSMSNVAPGPLSVLNALLLGLNTVSWVFFIFPILHLLLTFPDGRLLSSRWRPVVALEVFMVSLMLVTGLLGETVTSTDGESTLSNPIGFIPDLFAPIVDTLWNLGLLLLTLCGLMAITLRFARSKGVVRRQLKWVLFAVSVFALVNGVAAAIPGSEQSPIVDVLLPLSMIGIAVAVAVAVLRYRLYEIDRIVSRTIGYAVVVGVLAGAVALVSAVVGSQFESPLVVAATTLAVAAVFNPLRRRVQSTVDRRFNRSRFDAQLVMDDFAGSLRDRTDARELVEGWVEVVAETMQPSAVGIWLRFS